MRRPVAPATGKASVTDEAFSGAGVSGGSARVISSCERGGRVSE